MTTENDRRRLQISMRDVPEAGRDVNGRIPLDEVLRLDDEARITAPYPLAYDLHVEKVHEDAVVRGTLETRLRCHCDRCLQTYDKPVEIRDVCYFFEDVGEETIDLTDNVREDILLAFPQRLLCRPECKGLCPKCGQNLNRGTCSCPPPEQEESGPWDALDQLRIPDGNDPERNA